MQGFRYWLGCFSDFFTGLLHLAPEPTALPAGGTEATEDIELYIQLPVEPELPATLEGVTNPSTAAPPAAIPTAAWWLEAPLPLSETLVASLSRRLQASGELSPQDRIRLAYQRGQQGAAIRRGDRDWFEGNRCTLRNRCYVVLLGGNGDHPFFTWDLHTHQRAVRTGPGGTFGSCAISHGFASLAEAVAFSLGAGLPGLPRTI